ncbi:hypothetical protein [Micromonospora inyonensis]|uniref:Uncharacterized protein n=1 Tax=Micromonospora inyonensis TaxID=47866 RepID=A0A1C6RX41_9ACTN|nr:hypothetical protein [Micromonospora inyonensis]SCL21538.1 hypothetical protein GA0074694_3064 [Micromonospora inyonensis]SCL21756.1 hypothetical protein GA0074694_3136 [Micromonospora inyonensis]
MTTKTVVSGPDAPTRARRVDLSAQRAPHVAVGALVLAAGAARTAVHLTGDEATVAQFVAGTAFVVAVVAAAVVSRKRRVFGPKATARAVAFIATAAGWLTGVTVTGLSLGAVGILMAFGYGLALHWWREHRIDPGPARRKVDERPYVQRWKANLAGPGAALTGSVAMDEKPVEGGARFTVQLVPGKQELATVTGAAGKIRTGLGLRATDELVVEHHPSRDQSYIRVTVLEAAPVLKRDNVWPGPEAYNPTTGKVALGPHVDGDGYAQWRVYSSNSIWGGFLVGAQGSGKTRMMEGIVMSVVASTPTAVFFADGHGETGASSKLLRDHCDYFAGTADQLRTMLAGLHLVAEARFDDMLLDDLEGFTATEDRPGLILVIDECHKFFEHDDIQYTVANMITEFRKVGFAVIAATQSANLNRAFGTGDAADALRGALLTGNGVVLRIKSGSIKDVLKLPYDPRDFPDIPGYARMVDESRGAAFRGFRVTDEQVETLPKQLRWLSLSPPEAAAFGPAYDERKLVRVKAKAEALKRRQQRQAGIHTPPPVSPSVAAATATGVPPQVVAELLEDVVFPVWPGSMEPPTLDLSDSHRRILDAVGGGRQQPKDVMEAVGLGSSRFYQLASELQAHGYLTKTGKGPAARYTATEKAHSLAA